MKKSECLKLYVPRNACYVSFVLSKHPVSYSVDEFNGVLLETVRGEQLIIDFDKKGFVVGFELLSAPGARKSCQSSR